MDGKARDLRRHAANCRFMARSAVSVRARTDLFAMAMELDDEAAALDAADPIDPEC